MNPVRGLVRGVTRGTKGVVNRVLQGLHTLHTFFEKRGREGLGFFFSFWSPQKKIKKNLGPPGLSILAKARKPCKVCNGAGAPGFFFSSAAAGCARHWGPLHTAEAHTDGRESEGAKGRAGPFIRARTLSGGEVALARARGGGPRA